MISTYRIDFCFILLLQVYITDLSHTMVKNGALRIIGGQNATSGEFPYVIRLELQKTISNRTEDIFYYRFVCTCTLFKPTWSLTAAHCMIQMTSESPKTRAVLRYDLLDTRKTGTSLIFSLIKHPNYYANDLKQYPVAFNDIGLIQSEEVPIMKYAAISSIDYTSLLGHQVLDLGYGWTVGPGGNYESAIYINKSLQVLDVIVTKCALEITDHPRIMPSFCTMGHCGKWSTAGYGDSGGPIIHPSGIVGVLVSGEVRNLKKESAMPTKLHTFAGISTPTSPFIDWIAKTTR